MVILLVVLILAALPHLRGLTVSEDTDVELHREVLSIIEACHKKVTGLLEENKAVLQKISEHLIFKETINGEEFMGILGERV